MIRSGHYLNRPKGSRIDADVDLGLVICTGSRAKRRHALRQCKRQALAGNEDARVLLLRLAGLI